MSYTQLAVLGVLASVVLDLWVLRTRLLTSATFWWSYPVIIFFQLLTNGVLTGTHTVLYRGTAILGDSTPVLFGHWRIVYAPVEDLAFGFALVVQALAWWVFWGRRGVARD